MQPDAWKQWGPFEHDRGTIWALKNRTRELPTRILDLRGTEDEQGTMGEEIARLLNKEFPANG